MHMGNKFFLLLTFIIDHTDQEKSKMQISQIHINQPNFGWEGPKALEVSKLGSMGEVEKKVAEVWTSLMMA